MELKINRIHRVLMAVLCLLYVSVTAQAQPRNDIAELQQPRLVVGLVVDQMRWDYLTRFADRYGDGGFRRIMREGYNCNRTFINYLPAVTAVGHSSVWTATVPAFHGITGNHIYKDGRRTYCTTDTTVLGVGSLDRNGRPDPRAYGSQESPRNLKCTTIGDELRLATNFRSKVVGVALKDRASILPAGHAANAAYWMDDRSTNFITSTYYMDDLPQWAKDFNAQRLGDKYMKNLKKGHWDLLYDEKTYVQSAPRGQRWEDSLNGSLKQSPWGMTITFDMARAAVEGENLGHNP
nr:alkaline phosphatase family protein [Bacteroidaceae bacterium]